MTAPIERDRGESERGSQAWLAVPAPEDGQGSNFC